ncbi:hypothetical protein PCIT_a1200 [Pseudoalteromonas citrea]|uniref:Uncharacterized protein n=2 Tax=Pseudoalteromonas citrea TaxID=43655 RepID=A0AAD4ALV1_9GAMM|nr:hypothetical protein [Pseudoalteromonas citrea]KAF7775097.1 hypothetical protein PCIT_a1200 [Pseudoalteromonas citrea]
MYQHTQFAWAIWAILAWIATFLVMAIVLSGSNAAILLFAGILLLVAVFFYGLTIKVDSQSKQLTWWLGPGLIKKTLSFEEIEAVRAVKNSLRHGIGMKITNDGWVYAVSGFSAIEITLHDGMKYRVGTNDPNGVLKALVGNVMIKEDEISGVVKSDEEPAKKRKKGAFDLD